MRNTLITFILCSILITCIPCSIAAPEKTLLYSPWTNVVLNGVAVLTSPIIPLKQVKNMGVWVKATSVAGVPHYTLHYETSYDGVLVNFAVPDRALFIFGDNTAAGLTDTEINDANIHQDAFSPPCMGFIRFVLTGKATNPVDSIVTARVNVQ